MQFQNRVVVVTGGARGIGEGCSRMFAAALGTVAILDRDTVAAEKLADELNQLRTGSAIAIGCDVTDFPALQHSIDHAAHEFGKLDCIVANAGAHPPATALSATSIQMVDDLMRLNFTSTFAACQFALPHLRKTRGSIVIMSSMTALLGQPMSSAYCASKAAQLGLMRGLAVELGTEGIRVNAICPSNVDTPLMRDWAATLPDPASALQRVSAVQVLGRMASIDEIGRIAVFLASDAASFITGQAIQAEGGASLDY